MTHAKTQEERQQRRKGNTFVLFNSVYIITPGTLQTDNKWLQNEWMTNRKLCLEGNSRVGDFKAAVAVYWWSLEQTSRASCQNCHQRGCCSFLRCGQHERKKKQTQSPGIKSLTAQDAPDKQTMRTKPLYVSSEGFRVQLSHLPSENNVALISKEIS